MPRDPGQNALRPPMSPQQDIARAIVDHASKDEQKFKNYVAKSKRAAEAEAPHHAKIAGKMVYLDKGAPLPSARGVTDALARAGATKTQSRTEADIFVVGDVEAPGQRVRFACGLVGGILCTFPYIESQGAAGMALAFKPHMSSRRVAWISGEFLRAHPSLSDVIISAAGRSLSKWVVMEPDSCLVFVERAKKETTAKRPPAVAFVVEADKGKPVFAGVRITFHTAASAMVAYCQLDARRCAIGACHR